jgi:hypothetical protein
MSQGLCRVRGFLPVLLDIHTRALCTRESNKRACDKLCHEHTDSLGHKHTLRLGIRSFRNSRNTELDATNRSISRGEHWEITRGEHWEMGQSFGCEPLPSLMSPDEPLIAPGSQSSRMCSPRPSLVETPRTRTPRSPTTRGDAAYESKFTLQSLHSQRGSLLESDTFPRTATSAWDAKFTLNSSVNSSAHPRVLKSSLNYSA